MSSFRRFEEIEAWKLARVLTNDIYDVTSKSLFNRDYALRDQMRRASISIVSNMAEGYERDGDKEFVQFLFVAKGSCGEVRAQLYLAHDRQYLCDEEFHALSDKATELSCVIAGLIKYLRNSQISGRKYKIAAQS